MHGDGQSRALGCGQLYKIGRSLPPADPNKTVRLKHLILYKVNRKTVGMHSPAEKLGLACNPLRMGAVSPHPIKSQAPSAPSTFRRLPLENSPPCEVSELPLKHECVTRPLIHNYNHLCACGAAVRCRAELCCRHKAKDASQCPATGLQRCTLQYGTRSCK